MWKILLSLSLATAKLPGVMVRIPEDALNDIVLTKPDLFASLVSGSIPSTVTLDTNLIDLIPLHIDMNDLEVKESAPLSYTSTQFTFRKDGAIEMISPKIVDASVSGV